MKKIQIYKPKYESNYKIFQYIGSFKMKNDKNQDKIYEIIKCENKKIQVKYFRLMDMQKSSTISHYTFLDKNKQYIAFYLLKEEYKKSR